MRLTFAFCLLIFAFLQPPKSHFSKLQKRLEGTWKLPDEMPGEQYFESWKKINQTLSVGQSFKIRKGRDTIVLEDVRLEKRPDDSVFYIVKLPHDPTWTPFKLTVAGSKKWLFENPEHDFPQKIEYDFFHRDSLRAAISGPFNGEEKQFFFPYSRVKK